MRAGVDDALKAIFPLSAEDAELIKRLTPLWIGHMKRGWDFAREHDLAGRGNPFEIEDPRVMAAIEARKIQGKHINETTREDMRGILRDNVETGGSTRDLADAIAGYFKERAIGEGAARAELAARTQTTGIVNDGLMIAAREAGGIKKVWIHGNPKEPRASHLAAQAKYMAAPIDVDEPFEIDGVEMQAPGDADAPIEETANCTCVVGFVPA